MPLKFSLLVGVLLLVGTLAEPFRLYQALTGRFRTRHPITPKARRRARWLFCCAFPFWLALLWGVVNVELLKRCSGDTCIGYMLLGLPFPFIYGLAEIQLLTGRPPSDP